MSNPSEERPVLRVVLVEDHAIFRQGLAALFEETPDVEVVGQAGDAGEGLRVLLEAAPDVAVVDLNLPDKPGIELIREWRSESSDAVAVVLTSNRDPAQAIAAAQAGVKGYVLKDDVFNDLARAVQEAHSGKRFFSSSVSELLVGHQAEAPASLTAREQEVLEGVAGGDTNRRIAGRLGVSVKTVESHRSNLMQKLDVHSAAELVRVAIERGLISVDKP